MWYTFTRGNVFVLALRVFILPCERSDAGACREVDVPAKLPLLLSPYSFPAEFVTVSSKPSSSPAPARRLALLRLTEQLAHDAPPAGADRTADRKLVLAHAATGQQKDGTIGAADDEQEHNACEKKRQRAAGLLRERQDDGLQREMPVIGEARGMPFCKAIALKFPWLADHF